MRITSKGQVTIPQHLRQRLGLLPHAEVEFLVVDGGLRIVRVENSTSDDRGSRIGQRVQLLINPIIYAEVSIGFERVEELELVTPA